MLKAPWYYMALSDRETLLTGFLGWLLDPEGDHGFGTCFLELVLKKAEINTLAGYKNLSVKVRAKSGNKREFDILIMRNGERFAVSEVKCKTSGSIKQLERYSEQVPHVLRIGYGEWNFPKLTNEQRKRYPFISFEELAKYMMECSGRKYKYYDLISSLSDYLRNETSAFKAIKQYYFDDYRSLPPEREIEISFGNRFINQLFWKWFVEHLYKFHIDLSQVWEIKSDKSGVWCKGGHVEVPPNKYLLLEYLGVNLPGPFHAWIHLELLGKLSLFGSKVEYVGRAQLRIKGEPEKHRQHIYKLLQEWEGDLRNKGFSLTKRRPSTKKNYHSPLTKRLTREDMKMVNLVKLLKYDFKFRVIDMEI